MSINENSMYNVKQLAEVAVSYFKGHHWNQ